MITVLIAQDKYGGLLPEGLPDCCNHKATQVTHHYGDPETVSESCNYVDIIIIAYHDFLNSYKLLKQFRADDPAKSVILITQSTDYNEILSAVNLSVSAIIPYPVENEKLAEQFNRITHGIKNIKKTVKSANESSELKKQLKQQLRRTFIDEFLLSNSSFINSIEEINSEFGLNFSKGLFTVIFLKVDDRQDACMSAQIGRILKHGLQAANELFNENCQECIIFTRGSFLVLLLNYHNGTPIKDSLNVLMIRMKKSAGSRFLISAGVSRTVSDPREIKTSFEDAVNAIQNRCIEGTGRIYYSSDLESPSIPLRQFFPIDRVSELTAYTIISDSDGIMSVIDGVFDDLQACERICPATLFGLCRKIEYLARDAMDALESQNMHDIADTLMQALEFAYNIKMVKEHLTRWIIELSRSCRLIETENAITPSIRRAIKYINLHATEKLTLTVVSKAVGLSPSYLSSAFKKQIGCGFCEYIHNRRISLASNLLTDTSLTISQISRQVGFSDYRYFTRLFSKHTGSSPNKYRKASVYKEPLNNLSSSF